MANDINSLIANYLQNSGSNLEASEVAERMNNLGQQIGYYALEGREQSVFEYGDEATEGELYDYLESVCGIDDKDQFADDVNLLFSILDTSGDGVLSDDELAIFKRTAGSYSGKITDYKMYDLLTYDADGDSISSKLETDEDNSVDETDEASSSSVQTLTDEEISAIADKIASGEASLEDYEDTLSYSQYLQLEEAVNTALANLAESDADDADVETDEASSSSVSTLTDEDISAIADKIASGEASLEDYEDTLSHSQYLQLEEAVDTAVANLGGSDADDTDVSEGTGVEDVDTDDNGEGTDVDAEEETVSDFSDKDYAKSFINTFIDDTLNTPQKVIDWLLDEGIITEDQAGLIKQAYTSYSSSEEDQIDALMELGYSYEEAIETLEKAGKLSSDDSALNTEVEKQQETISEEDAKIYAANLYSTMKGAGTKDSQFKSILNNENLSDDDWVAIIAAYNDEYGSFISDIDGDFKLSGRGEIFNTIADKLISAAENGNEDAIEVLCKEIHNATAGQIGTADGFINSVISSDTSDDVLAAIIRNYSTVNEGSDIYSDIRSDFTWVTGENTLINRLNEALSNSN